MRKINEIFYSLQGEGYHTGKPSVFIRFSGCNLKCSFCDTQHNDGNLMSDEEIIDYIAQFPTDNIILTGGEPSLWIDDIIIDKLHKAGKYICIETNGTNNLPDGIDWITCSPKEGAILKLEKANELKVVFQNQDLTKYDSFEASHFFLQPCSCQNTQEVVDYILKNPKWRLSLQTHKLIDII